MLIEKSAAKVHYFIKSAVVSVGFKHDYYVYLTSVWFVCGSSDVLPYYIYGLNLQLWQFGGYFHDTSELP